MGKKLLQKQSNVENENDIACLPSLSVTDIIEKTPVFCGRSSFF